MDGATTDFPSPDRLDHLVEAACGLAARNPRFRRVMVVTDRRPTFAEVARSRERAERWKLDLGFDADGTLSLRTHRASAESAEPSAAPARHRSALRHRLVRLGPSWVTAEGVR